LKVKKILYCTNLIVPYRVKFFNELAKKCKLTVLFEYTRSSTRNEKWLNEQRNNMNFEYIFLEEKCKIKKLSSVIILRYLFGKYDEIVIGCFNEKAEALAIIAMKIFGKKYYLNLDGEVFRQDNYFKQKLQNFLIKGAYGYFVAGEACKKEIYKITNNKNITPYYFSSLSDEEIIKNRNKRQSDKENDILVIGQYQDYKGIDVVLKTAKATPKLSYLLIGVDKKYDLLEAKITEMGIRNVKAIPFLQKSELEETYKSCKIFVLPTKKECWGLVINEAASFGVPIVSTWGSGAAIEFLNSKYKNHLAIPNDSWDLKEKIEELISSPPKYLEEYSKYLLEKSAKYSIERSAKEHIKILNG